MAKDKNEKKIGRPTAYNKEIAEKICNLIASSNKGIVSICKENEDLPERSTIYNWLNLHKEFMDMYTRAKEDQADYLAEEMIEIADESSNDTMIINKGDSTYEVENKEWVNRSKLRVETRKWIAAKLKPRKYGDKIDLTSGGDVLQNQVPIINIITPEK